MSDSRNPVMNRLDAEMGESVKSWTQIGCCKSIAILRANLK
jgi:hypothetical protein